MDRYGVLVGYSGSARSKRALSYAAGMARRSGTALIVVHVARQSAVAAFFGFEPPAAGRNPYDGMRTLAEQLACEEHLSGLSWTLVRRSGVVADELEKAGRTYRANAIIVGRSRGAGGTLFRSISRTLMRRAHRPVIVVP
ncbi:universal stress protein [Streptomyces sp. NPDC088354]|uniref:universal stress protein n=1 Tax=unclassified Streptomyces TaxID=2593676 RepID=UPI0029B29CA7|nr:universal stress protein [Streptomyces sp. MI02-7b]MDX3077639.1 universal stress protein [Streptomyces sp. MI02-7b]